MKNKIIKKQSELILLQGILIGVILFVMVGITLNGIVISNNEGRMPVLEKNFEYKTKTEISYTENEEVEYPFFSDRYHLGDRIYSIGDFIMISGAGMVLVLCFMIFFKKEQINKLKLNLLVVPDKK